MTTTAAREAGSRGRRLYRAVAFAAIVGVAGAGLAVIPGLFVQSIFIGNAQRCERQQEVDVNATGEIQTNCAENLSFTPTWMPPAIIVGGGLMGLFGGFGYGLFVPGGRRERREEREQPWLPF